MTKEEYRQWQAATTNKLLQLRGYIDSADLQIKNQLVQRFAITNKVGLYKKAVTADTLQTGREDAILAQIAADVPKEQAESIQAIYREIMKQSRKQQDMVKANE